MRKVFIKINNTIVKDFINRENLEQQIAPFTIEQIKTLSFNDYTPEQLFEQFGIEPELIEQCENTVTIHIEWDDIYSYLRTRVNGLTLSNLWEDIPPENNTLEEIASLIEDSTKKLFPLTHEELKDVLDALFIEGIKEALERKEFYENKAIKDVENRMSGKHTPFIETTDFNFTTTLN